LKNLKVIIVTGLSGSGKGVAPAAFEDAGYYRIFGFAWLFAAVVRKGGQDLYDHCSWLYRGPASIGGYRPVFLCTYCAVRETGWNTAPGYCQPI